MNIHGENFNLDLFLVNITTGMLKVSIWLLCH